MGVGMTDAGKILGDLGFGEYEARVYLALLRRSPANGYEIAKASDIPRGNVYGVLQKLEERGAILRIDTPEGTRYTPVPPDELLARLSDRFSRTVSAASEVLEQAGSPAESAQVWNVDGYEALLEHGRSLLAGAAHELQMAVWPDEARILAAEMRAAAERGVCIRTLCLAGCGQECGACQGRVQRYRLLPEQPARWLIVAADRGEVLAGEIAGGGAAQAVRTRQRLLVDLITSYIRNSVALAAVVGSMGEDAAARLSPEAADALEVIGEAGGLGDWIRNLAQRPAEPGQPG